MAACSAGVQVIEPAKSPIECAGDTPSSCAKRQRDAERGHDADGPEQVPLQTRPAQAREELRAVLDADAIQEHGQADGTDEPWRRGVRRDGSDGKAGEQHRSDAERESGDRDLPQRVAEPDDGKQREQRRVLEDDPDPFQHARHSWRVSFYGVSSAARPANRRHRAR